MLAEVRGESLMINGYNFGAGQAASKTTLFEPHFVEYTGGTTEWNELLFSNVLFLDESLKAVYPS